MFSNSPFHQVETQFDDETCETGGKRKGRAHNEEYDNEQAERCKRHRNFLDVDKKNDAKTWRPLTRYRVGAKHFLEGLDNALQVMTHTGGLRFFKMDVERKGLWSSWRTWPFLQVAMDLGPKGLAAYNFLESSQKLNVEKVPDPSHGVHRDFDLLLVRNGLKGFWMAMMIHWNCEFGPEKEHGRKFQISQAMGACFRTSSPEQCPLFLANSRGIIANLESLEVKLEDDKMQAAWKHLKANAWAPTGFQRCNMNRFLGSLHTAINRLRRWNIDKFQRTWLAIETGMLTTKKVVDKLALRPSEAMVTEEGGSTSEAKISFEDKQTISFAKNAVITSVVMLSNEDHHWIVQLVCKVGEPVIEWHSIQNRELRSAKGTSEWVVSQVAGDLVAHLSAIVAQLSEPIAIASCGFTTTAVVADRQPECEEIYQDDFAKLFGRLTMCMVGLRVRRTLHLSRGWGCRLMRLLKGDAALSKATLEEFEKDVMVYETFEQMIAKQAIHIEFLKRHCFQKVSNLQLIQGCKEVGFEPHADLVGLLRQRSHLAMQTQETEDSIGTMKKTRLSRLPRRSSKSQRPRWPLCSGPRS